MITLTNRNIHIKLDSIYFDAATLYDILKGNNDEMKMGVFPIILFHDQLYMTYR